METSVLGSESKKYLVVLECYVIVVLAQGQPKINYTDFVQILAKRNIRLESMLKY